MGRLPQPLQPGPGSCSLHRGPRGSRQSEGQVGWAVLPAGCWEGGRTLQEASLGFLQSLKGPLV